MAKRTAAKSAQESPVVQSPRERHRNEYSGELATLEIACAGLHGVSTQSGREWAKGQYYGACSTSIPDSRLACYYGDLAEGGIVLDKRAIPNIVSCVLRAPLVDGSLPSGTVKRFGEALRKVALDMAPALGGGFQAIAAIAGTGGFEADNDVGGMDSVAVDVYVDYWRRHGARIGKRVGDTIAWADGSTSAIVPWTERYTTGWTQETAERKALGLGES